MNEQGVDADRMTETFAEVAQCAWRVLTPVLDAWAAGLVPMEAYAAGSAGPRDARRT